MKSRRLLFLAEILALLFVLERCATANNAACVFEHIDFGTSHRCFPSAAAIPSAMTYTNSGIMGTLGGVFVKGADDARNNSNNGKVLTLYPAAFVPIRHRAQNIGRDPIYILFRMIFMPKGRRHTALLRSR